MEFEPIIMVSYYAYINFTTVIYFFSLSHSKVGRGNPIVDWMAELLSNENRNEKKESIFPEWESSPQALLHIKYK